MKTEGICRRHSAQNNFLRLRMPGIRAQSQLDAFNTFEQFPPSTTQPYEMTPLIPYTIGTKLPTDNIASLDDLEKRKRYQIERYLDLSSSGQLTPQWKRYGSKNESEIRNFELSKAV